MLQQPYETGSIITTPILQIRTLWQSYTNCLRSHNWQVANPGDQRQQAPEYNSQYINLPFDIQRFKIPIHCKALNNIYWLKIFYPNYTVENEPLTEQTDKNSRPLNEKFRI